MSATAVTSNELLIARVSSAQEISPPNPTNRYATASNAVSSRRKADAREARLWVAACLIGLGIPNFLTQDHWDSTSEVNAAPSGEPREGRAGRFVRRAVSPCARPAPLIAPTTSPRSFLSGRIFTTALTREPSGRSTITSSSTTSGIFPETTHAIGHWSWGMKLPSGRNILIEPQNRSLLSPRAGVRPHNSAD